MNVFELRNQVIENCASYIRSFVEIRDARYMGLESPVERREILASPPDILLTNFVMLELLLTRPGEDRLIRGAQDLRFRSPENNKGAR